MYNTRKQIHSYIKTTLLALFLSTIFQLLSCMPQFNNPVSFNYEGDYKLNIVKRLHANLEILKDYPLSIENKGSDRYWRIYLSPDPNKTKFHTIPETLITLNTNISNPSLSIVFTNTFSTKEKIYLIAERPNRTKDSYVISNDSGVNIINPYKIKGDTCAGINDNVSLYIEYNGAPIYSPSTDSVSFRYKQDGVNFSFTKSLRDTFSIKNISSMIQTNAVLKFPKDSFPLEPHTINVKGHSPIIYAFYQKDTLTFGTTATFSVTCHDADNDNDSIHFRIIGDHNSHQDTLFDKNMPYDSINSLESDTIKDTSYTAIRLTISDASQLKDTGSLSDKRVAYTRPVVEFNQNDSTQSIGETIKLYVTSNSADKYYWRHGQKFDTTTTNFLSLPPYTTPATDTIIVYGEKTTKFSDTTFHVFGKPNSIILRPRNYDYQINPKLYKDTIKTKTATDFQFTVVHGADTLSDDSVRYDWELSNAANSSMIALYPNSNTHGSKVNITLTDSILSSFTMTIKAIYLRDTSVKIKQFSRTITVRSYSPFFKFNEKSITDSNILSFTIGYTANDTSGPGGQVSKIYFKQIDSLKTYSIDNGAPMNITFNTSGVIKVEGWAVDSEGNVSKKDTLTFNISITKPQFASVKDTIPTSIGNIVHLKAPALISATGNMTYRWNTNTDVLLDTATGDSNFLDLSFNSENTFLIQVQCTNAVGDTSTRHDFYVVVKKNAPTIKIFTVNDSTQYIKDTLKFVADIVDPDSGLTGIYLHRILGSVDTVIRSKSYTSPRDSIDTTFTDIPNDSGHYLYVLVANDQNGNSDSSTIPVVIDKGIPMVDSTSKKKIAFAKYETKILIKAQDNDSVYLKYFISYDNNTSFSAVGDTASPTYSDSGWKIYYVKVIDIDGQESPIYKDSVYVNSGAPLIKSIRIDSTIFIKTQRTFTITATDTNPGGSVSKVFVDWDNNSVVDSFVVSSDSIFKFNHTFTEAGIKNVNFWAIDNDGISSLIKYTAITIHKGAPHYICRYLADTANYWINDDIQFRFQCIDTNGTIQKMIIDWGDTSYVKRFDTIPPPQSATPGAMIFMEKYHKFPRVDDKQYTIAIKLIDNDTIDSTYYDSFRVKRGMPKITYPMRGDTLFARIANTGGNCTLSVACYDPNDTNLNYYWKLNSNSLDTIGSQRTPGPFHILTGIGDGSVNKNWEASGAKNAVFVKDPDGNMAIDTFFIYLDGPPDSTTITLPSEGTFYNPTDTVILQWTGLDKHDSISTQFAIMIGSGNPIQYDTLRGFTPAISFKNGSIFEYRFKPASGYIYTIRIISKDRSGNVIWGRIRQFAYTQ